MAIFKKMFKKFLGFEDEEIEEFEKSKEYEEFEEEEVIETSNNQKNVFQQKMESIPKTEEIILYPKTFADACDVVEQLEIGYTVVVNMDDVDIDTCKRISDFILGAIYVLEGDVEKLSKKVFRFWTNK